MIQIKKNRFFNVLGIFDKFDIFVIFIIKNGLLICKLLSSSFEYS